MLTTDSVPMTGTIYNQFYRPNPEASPARKLARNLEQQLNSLETHYKERGESFNQQVDRNVAAKE